jgi:hypothetical protein
LPRAGAGAAHLLTVARRGSPDAASARWSVAALVHPRASSSCELDIATLALIDDLSPGVSQARGWCFTRCKGGGVIGVQQSAR